MKCIIFSTRFSNHMPVYKNYKTISILKFHEITMKYLISMKKNVYYI